MTICKLIQKIEVVDVPETGGTPRVFNSPKLNGPMNEPVVTEERVFQAKVTDQYGNGRVLFYTKNVLEQLGFNPFRELQMEQELRQRNEEWINKQRFVIEAMLDACPEAAEVYHSARGDYDVRTEEGKHQRLLDLYEHQEAEKLRLADKKARAERE